MSGSRGRLSLSYHNFYDGFDPHTCYFTRVLDQAFDVHICDNGADLQISSVFGTDGLPNPRGGRPLRVWWSGEARDPQAQIFDIFFGFRHHMPLLEGRWFRLPLWAMDIDWWDDASPTALGTVLGPRDLSQKDAFCNFIFSNDVSVRAEFFLRLNAVRAVDSHGRVLNNRGSLAPGYAAKLAAMRRCRFSIAFENQIAPGYVTEKPLHAFMAHTIPIYWGAREAREDFNPAAFIDATAFDTMDDLVRHVVSVADSPTRSRGSRRRRRFAVTRWRRNTRRPSCSIAYARRCPARRNRSCWMACAASGTARSPASRSCWNAGSARRATACCGAGRP